MASVACNVRSSDMQSKKKDVLEMTWRLPATVKKDGDWYVSCCPILDVWSQGEDKEEALSNLIAALTGFFVSCFERGTLDAVLRECGFSMAAQPKRQRIPKACIPIDVPIPYFVNQAAARACLT